MTHAHITTWVLALILFFVALGLHNSGKAKGAKIVQMVLRLFYILIIVTGALMLHSIASISFEYVLKTIIGIWVIASLEMILVRTAKNKSTKGSWIQLVISFIIVMYLGLSLPLGFWIFQ